MTVRAREGGRDEESRSGTGSGCANSFDGATPVRLADGATKPIEAVKVGDRVWAADPVTHERGARRVTRVIVGVGLKLLVAVTVLTAAGPATVTATANHPFWVASRHAWVPAGELRPGEALLTPDEHPVPVVGTRTYAEPHTVSNLSVDGLHTYFVGVGAATVLVHNACPPSGPQPKLRLLHDENTIKNNPNYGSLQQASTDELVDSLRPGAAHPLIVKPDGAVVNGNTRIYILQQRGYDVDSLPREVHVSIRPEEMYD